MMFFGQTPNCTPYLSDQSCRLRSTDSGERVGSARLLAGSAGKSMLSRKQKVRRALLDLLVLPFCFFPSLFFSSPPSLLRLPIFLSLKLLSYYCAQYFKISLINNVDILDMGLKKRKRKKNSLPVLKFLCFTNVSSCFLLFFAETDIHSVWLKQTPTFFCFHLLFSFSLLFVMFPCVCVSFLQLLWFV